ncbi:MAG: penicillin acylase family protein [Candidatus Neomarinimicrobiota bacterium]|nr:MAG: penicillin acylase family protein [Candidatus Neomarinimicrobiota bacterium]
MKKHIRWIVGIFLLLFAGGYLLFQLRFSYDLPSYSGTLNVAGLREPVHVFTDEYGVPHVFARNEEDLFFTSGYLMARERLFQMTVISAAASGELSTLFGKDLLSSDIYLRTWGIPRVAREMAAQMDPGVKHLVQSYCNGINRYIADVGNQLPPEFRILGVSPRMWTPVTVCAFARLMAHDLQQSWKPEILFGAVLETYGQDMLEQLLPPYDRSRPTIVPSPGSGLSRVFGAVTDAEHNIRNLLGMNGLALGSNNWVISGSRTATGKPLLANDPHLGYTQPAKWFEMHLKGGRFDVSGVCLPGLPLPVIGQTAACAWGFTNVMADDIDFFIEKVDPAHPDHYLVDGNWLPMTLRQETIPLPGGQDTTITIRETKHGPVISDIHPLLRDSGMVVSMAWTGHTPSREIEALLRMGTIHNWDEFTAAVQRFTIPGQNIVYADTMGNIGWRPAVRLPIREAGSNLLPRDGSDSRWDWKGSVPFEKMPFLFNPPEGLIITANNKTIDDSFPYYISNLWADPSRAMRIRERIGNRQSLSVEDMKTIQNDVVSVYARELLPTLVALLPEPQNSTEKEAAARLRQWDGSEDAESVGAAIFHTLLIHCLKAIYQDELEAIHPEAYAAFVELPLIPLRNLQWTLAADSSQWLDNIHTPDYRERRSDIVADAFRSAVADLERRLGRHPGQWTWGRLHTLTIPHALGSVSLLDRLFHLNVGPFPTGGSSTTINNGEYRIGHPFEQIVGPSMRRIVDLKHPNRTQIILPTGQSGLPRSPHYADQTPLYLSGRYRTTYFDEQFIRQSAMDHLVLVPR